MPTVRSNEVDAARRLFRMTLGSRAPLTDGVTTVEGITHPVEIRRDAWHVPHITADDDLDAWFGLGFCQGQDRSFQIELYRRIARGTLAALIGKDGLEIDRMSRRLGFHRTAVAQLDAQRPRVRAQLEAFAAGVTAGREVGSPRPAHEFTLLRSSPEPHEASDVVAAIGLFSFLLAANWETELARLEVLTHDGHQALVDLDPVYAAHLPVTAPPGTSAGSAANHLLEDLEMLRGVVGFEGGSNNWAVAADRSATGGVLVANDPHLPPQLPSQWYLAHVSTPGWSVAGAAFAGTPAIAAGHNGHGAWGATAGHTDNTDLFLEEVDGHRVRDAGGTGDSADSTSGGTTGRDNTNGSAGWVEADVLTEVIEVRGGHPVSEEVFVTPRGPIVGPAMPGSHDALSIAGTWMDAVPVEGFLALPRARSFDDLRAAFQDWPGFQLNVVWGDTDGHIGWQLVGSLPQRRSGNGTVPLPGWRDDVGWEDERVPFEAMPHAVDPELGLIATANNKPVAEPYEAFLGVDWLEGYRAAAIVEALYDRDDWDVDDMLRLQVDVRSIPWLELRGLIADVPAHDPDTALGLELLRDWDGQVAADSAPAAVFELFVADLATRIVRAKAPRAAHFLLGAALSPVTTHSILALRRTSHLIELLRQRPDGWFEAGWDEVVAASLAAAVHRLRDDHGDDPSSWAWGSVRPLRLTHPVGEAVGVLASVFDRGPFPWGGDANTIAQCSPSPLEPTANPIAIATLRMVVDTADWERSRWVLAGGQSGNPVSPHYDDQLALWRRAEGIPIPFATDEVAAATEHTLRLLPTASAGTSPSANSGPRSAAPAGRRTVDGEPAEERR